MVTLFRVVVSAFDVYEIWKELKCLADLYNDLKSRARASVLSVSSKFGGRELDWLAWDRMLVYLESPPMRDWGVVKYIDIDSVSPNGEHEHTVPGRYSNVRSNRGARNFRLIL